MFDLHAGVHLNEVELARLVQKLKGARAPVAHLLAGGDAALANAFDQLAVDVRRRCFFQDFLVAPLHGAIALAQIDRVLKGVGQDLDFDVARVLEKFLHVHRRVAKGSTGFGLGHGHGIDERGFGMHHAHAASAAAACGLDDDGVAHGFGNAPDLRRVVGQLALRTRHAGDAGADHGLLGRDLVAHEPDRLGRGADELEAAFLHAFGKVGVFAQEAVAGVDGFGVGYFCRRNNGRHIEVAEVGRSRANAHGFFGQAHVFGVAVGLGIHHDRLDTQLAAGALDSERDLAAVGDQDFFEHGCAGLFNGQQRLPVFHRLAVFAQDLDDLARLVGLNFVEDLHGLDDANRVAHLDGVAHFHKRFGAGRG